jgi:hypothetical protein
MAVRCSYCERDYDVTLFEFGKTVKCSCGHKVHLNHIELKDETRYLLMQEEMKISDIRLMADRISFLIVATDYPHIDIEIDKQKLQDKIGELFPEKAYLYELIYAPRFRRLAEQFRGINP